MRVCEPTPWPEVKLHFYISIGACEIIKFKLYVKHKIAYDIHWSIDHQTLQFSNTWHLKTISYILPMYVNIISYYMNIMVILVYDVYCLNVHLSIINYNGLTYLLTLNTHN